MQNRPHTDLRGRPHAEFDLCDIIGTGREFSSFRNTAAHCCGPPHTEEERRNRQSERNQTIYVDTQTAAAHVGLSVSYMHKARHFGHGPPYYRVGRAIRYSIEDLDRWMAEHRVAGKRGC